ncbi:MAG: hypothetical protein B6D44_13225 [Ignavibacteriales bacterium UTCHB2]|jgi:SAM-dependent methyltransferase|nr:MAG: hypothetical protein B6D44_13225 [Ignavibacteriales bacterium UTCHB2]
MKREKNVERLSSFQIPLNHTDYIVYKSYHYYLFSCLEKYAKGKLLDIGCGNKPYSTIVSPFIESYTGCDIVQSSDKVVDILCQATDIPLESNSFDTVISTQTIEHVADHQRLVNEAYRLLRPGGYFVISGPMYWPLHEEPFDFFRFTKYGFRYILEAAGFKIVEENANGGKWAVFGQVLLHTLNSNLNKNNGFKWALMRRVYRILCINMILNTFFIKMDEKFYDESNTINYVIVTKK